MYRSVPTSQFQCRAGVFENFANRIYRYLYYRGKVFEVPRDFFENALFLVGVLVTHIKHMTSHSLSLLDVQGFNKDKQFRFLTILSK